MSIAKAEKSALVENAGIRQSLAHMVYLTSSNSVLRDDLMQEALVHIWLTENRRPGQTRSWYLQSCRHHLRHYLASGRSVDSFKRGAGRIPLGLDGDDQEGELNLTDTDSVLSLVCARDLVSELSRRLAPLEKAVLEGLANGLRLREIGLRLKLSHTMVVRHRWKIASTLTKLDPGIRTRSNGW